MIGDLLYRLIPRDRGVPPLDFASATLQLNATGVGITVLDVSFLVPRDRILILYNVAIQISAIGTSTTNPTLVYVTPPGIDPVASINSTAVRLWSPGASPAGYRGQAQGGFTLQDDRSFGGGFPIGPGWTLNLRASFLLSGNHFASMFTAGYLIPHGNVQ